MIVRGGERVLVQGITGKQGTFWTERMQAYGTRVVGGVNPKRAGAEHCGVPVFANAGGAMREVGFDVSVLFIPPLGVRAAAIDAIEAGCPRLVVLTEHVPVQDVMEVLAAARANGAAVAGPNTAGLVTPGECFVGFMPAFEPDVFRPGRIGVVSRSGSLGTLVCLDLVQAGLRRVGLHRDRRRPDHRHDHPRCGGSPRRRRPHGRGGGGGRDRGGHGGGGGRVRPGHAKARRCVHRGRGLAPRERRWDTRGRS